ncbi:DsbC family protein [Ramlibacter sp.]|uniref:DsbC family protein n=1 Tax=Ramlibacter sp. TaxID=1917967 RepID=UPI0018510A70|nr:DsbC family protein [Ramlibacter sp.]MBA2674889.1 DsbC family protein [Ramlibacter sp.]
MTPIRRALRAGFAALALVAALAQAQGPATLLPGQEALLRKNLAERMPQMPKIDEVTRAPIAGLLELRIGADIFYSDMEGNFLLEGEMVETKTRRNLTQERVNKLTAIDFDKLPVKDAFVIVRGDGKRKLAVFEDPNCPYCKRFERDLQKVDNVTVYMYLYPILGQDSADKSRSIWCAKDRGKAWLDFMVRDQAVVAATCDVAPIARNVEFGKKHRITGTPTMVFTDGTRVPGAVGADQIEKLLASSK